MAPAAERTSRQHCRAPYSCQLGPTDGPTRAFTRIGRGPVEGWSTWCSSLALSAEKRPSPGCHDLAHTRPMGSAGRCGAGRGSPHSCFLAGEGTALALQKTSRERPEAAQGEPAAMQPPCPSPRRRPRGSPQGEGGREPSHGPAGRDAHRCMSMVRNPSPPSRSCVTHGVDPSRKADGWILYLGLRRCSPHIKNVNT